MKQHSTEKEIGKEDPETHGKKTLKAKHFDTILY